MTYENSDFSDQAVYISGQFLPGLQSVNTTFEFPEENELGLGYSTPVANELDGNIQGEFSTSRLLVSDADPVTGHFANGVSGHLRYQPDKAYVFETGLITRYSATCELNEVPSLDFTMETWGKFFTSVPTIGDQPGPEEEYDVDLYLPSAGDVAIEITDCGGGSQLDLKTNAVRSFEYDIVIDWEPINTLGNVLPQGFYIRYPITVDAIITIELNDFIEPDFLTKVCQPIQKDITLKVNACAVGCEETKQLLRKFYVPDARLLEINNFADMDDVLMAELVFRSTITNIVNIGALVGK